MIAALLPYYPKGDGRGRPPIGLERMPRMYIAQQCLGLSDDGIDDAIYDIGSVRSFVGGDLIQESAPDATKLLKFRRLLEENDRKRRPNAKQTLTLLCQGPLHAEHLKLL